MNDPKRKTNVLQIYNKNSGKFLHDNKGHKTEPDIFNSEVRLVLVMININGTAGSKDIVIETKSTLDYL